MFTFSFYVYPCLNVPVSWFLRKENIILKATAAVNQKETCISLNWSFIWKVALLLTFLKLSSTKLRYDQWCSWCTDLPVSMYTQLSLIEKKSFVNFRFHSFPCRFFALVKNRFHYVQPFKCQSHEMVKHTQTIRRQIADELLECVWPFCEICAKRVSVSHKSLQNIWQINCQ